MNTRILLDIKHALDRNGRQAPITAVRLSPLNAALASERIKNVQRAMTPTPPPWAAYDAPPVRQFLGLELIPDEAVPDGWMRLMRGGLANDVQLTVIPDGDDGDA